MGRCKAIAAACIILYSVTATLRLDYTFSIHASLLGVRRGHVRDLAQVESLSQPKGDVDVAHDPSEELVTRAPGVDGDVDEGVDSLALRHVNVASHGKSGGVVLRVEKVTTRVGDGRDALVVRVDLKVLALVRDCGPPVSNGVAGVPGDGEAVALRAGELSVVGGKDTLGDGVGRKARVLVYADGVALGAVRRLGLEEFRVGATVNVD
jgi:hypothetical protein